MVVAASQNPPGVEPHAHSIPAGVPPVAGARCAAPNPIRGPNPNLLDRQQQGNWPFFYIPPSQPYLPCQWPMPMPYAPYGGFPGLGYGMMLPPFPASYMDTPGYILPHTQLHMVDYRRMVTPYLAPTMAYQARRFRYQHAPSGRVMVSSEVQTEPVHTDSLRQSCHSVTSTHCSLESGRSTDSTSVLSSPRPIPDKSACPEKGCSMSSKPAGETPRLTTVQNGGILFQAEEVRFECSGSPSAVKITHSKETAELASNADGELLHCNLGSAEDVVLRFQSVQYENDEEGKGTKDLSHLDEPCPDIVMVSCPSNGSVSTLDGSIVAPVEPVNSTLAARGDSNLVKNAQDICGNPKNIHFKILKLPVDLQCLDELQQMEASIWSVESLMPYMPTSEWMMQNSLMTPGKPSLATVMEVPAESPLQSEQLPADTPPSLLEAGAAIELDGQESMTSLESLPPFLPSGSRLAGFNNAYKKLSANVSKVNPADRSNGQLETNQDNEVQSKPRSPNVAPNKLKEEITNKSVASGVSLSDQDHCVARLFPESPIKHKVRMCKSCSVKCSVCICSGSPSSKTGSVKRHKVSHAHLKGEKVKIPLCAACMRHPEKARCKVAGVAINLESNLNNDMNEVSENDLYPPKKCSKMLYDSRNLHSSKHLENCPVSYQSKLREQNCSCEDMKASHSISAWNGKGHGQRTDMNWERNEENLAVSSIETWRDTEPRFAGEKPLRGSIQVSDSESTKSGGRTKPRNKQKQCTQSLDVHRRDTRC